jgi:hypothetical protein
VLNVAAVSDGVLRVPNNITVRGGHYLQYASGNIISALTVDNFAVDSATVGHFGTTTATYFGIIDRSASTATEGALITNCRVLGSEGGGTLAAGVRVAAGGANIGQTEVSSNRIKGSVVGIMVMGSSGHTSYPVVALNNIEGATTVITAETAYVIHGSQPGVVHIVFSGSPEGVYAAPVGSLYSRTDGGASTTLYVKTSGTGNTGWTAK